MANELYVGHISEQATEDDLRKLFSVMGPVTSVHLIVDQETGEFKRCGYVRMLASVNLKEVVETLDGAWLIDRCIVVSVAKPQKDRPVKNVGARKKPGSSGRFDAAAGSARPVKPSPAGASPKSERPARTGRQAESGRPSAAKKTGSTRRSPSKGRPRP